MKENYRRESVFDELNWLVKQNEKGIDNILETLTPIDNFVERIEQELNEREGDLSDQQTWAAEMYLKRDYKKSANSAKDYFRLAEKETSLGRGYFYCLKEALRYINRAAKDIGIMKRIYKGDVPGMSNSYVQEYLDNFRRNIDLAWRFPDHDEESLPLYMRLQIAEEEERYEEAAKIWAEIKSKKLIQLQAQLGE